MNLTRALFKLASILTTGKIISSGNAGRIGKHIVRRQLFKGAAKRLRRW